MFGTTRRVRRNDRAIARTLLSVVIAFGSCCAAGFPGAAPAGADPTPFTTLSSSCPGTAPAGSPASRELMTQGIRRGISDWSARGTRGDPADSPANGCPAERPAG